MPAHQEAPRGLRRDDADVNETGASAGQFLLFPTERQLTLDGRQEPLVATPAAELVGSKGEGVQDERTLLLPLPGVADQKHLPLPGYCRACQRGRWHLRLHHRESGERKRVPFKCHSWRHAGECARWSAARDFARICQALEGEKPEDALFVVLTFHQKRDAACGLSPEEGYRLCGRRWQSMRQWIERHFGKSKYVGTIEQHRTGWPHLNLIIINRDLAAAVREENRDDGRAPGWLKGAAVRSGFGPVAWAEAPRDVKQLAGYIVKLAHRESLTGEVVKLSQLPVNAPKGTRRTRASQRWLPPTRKANGEWTGELLTHSVEEAERIDADAARFEAEAQADADAWLTEAADRLMRAKGAPSAGLGGAQLGQQGQPGAPRGRRLGGHQEAIPDAPFHAPASGGGAAGSGAEPRLVATRTSHSVALGEDLFEALPDPRAGADPPSGRSSAAGCTPSSVANADDEGRSPSIAAA